MSVLHVNARFLAQPASGTQRFAGEILNALDKLLDRSASPLHVIAWLPPGTHHENVWRKIEPRETGCVSGHVWEQTALAWAAREGWLLNLVSSAPIAHPRQLLTFHDAAIFSSPENFSRKYGAFHRAIRPRLASRAQKIFTVSRFSQAELARAMQIDSSRFEIIPNGCDHLLREVPDYSILQDNGVQHGRYVLFVGNRAPHKNFATALSAFKQVKRPDLQLVTVGVGRSDIFGKHDFAEQHGVLHLARTSDAQLAALYEKAAMLVFPSCYEGFGIPPLEAMSLGCPVIASTAAAIPETVGDAALLIDPGDVEGLATAMITLLDDPSLADDLRTRGRAQAAHFRWDDAAAKLLAIIERSMTSLAPLDKAA